ncbi:class I SAM-dependent methyltransferase [Dyella sp. Tek66A03]|uniref:class I SAM-dependent methyltransferase n=1 Tax=Dyella sp. Tek66A03 TaxID=3458298 RepID=UPI00403EE930
MSMLSWSYDRIAELYATDMGQSMPFDDVAWYRSFARHQGGNVLELGCGTGRILLDLAAAGIPILGIDRSLPMLSTLHSHASVVGLEPAVVQMDMRNLGLRGNFRTILLPYSLITYLPDPAEAKLLLTSLHGQLEANGRVVVDTFIPKPVQHFADFILDYKRPHGDGTLERSKRITLLSQRRHRIERRYVLRDRQGLHTQAIQTEEVIKPYAMDELIDIAQRAGYAVASCHFDYGAQKQSSDSRFVTMILRRT